MKFFEIRNEVREKQRKKGVKRKWNKSICSQMPDYFYCINKGILVNMNYVKRIENSEVVMTYLENEVRHPLARDKRKDFRERFFEYME